MRIVRIQKAAWLCCSVIIACWTRAVNAVEVKTPNGKVDIFFELKDIERAEIAPVTFG